MKPKTNSEIVLYQTNDGNVTVNARRQLPQGAFPGKRLTTDYADKK